VVGEVVERVVAADRGHPPLGSPVVVQDVAERAREIGELATVAEPPGPREDAQVGLLREVLGEVPRAAQRVREVVQARQERRGGMRIEHRHRGTVSGLELARIGRRLPNLPPPPT
jgi:hypothetical protein